MQENSLGLPPPKSFPISYSLSSIPTGLVHRIRHQSHLPRTLYGQCNLALVLSAVSGDPTRNDLAAFIDVSPQPGRVFVIYILDFVDTEGTDSPSGLAPSFSSHLYGTSTDSGSGVVFRSPCPGLPVPRKSQVLQRLERRPHTR